jgi:ubiquinone/menaquinone biosynthesis C-methylase UbiE
VQPSPTSAGRIGGFEWQNADNVTRFLSREDKSEHELAFEHFAGILPFPKEAAVHILDLGAGAGAFSTVLLDYFPNSSAVLADFSPAMMEAGAESLKRFAGRYRYVELDMNGATWPAALTGPFEAVVSSRAIHHFMNDQKAVIFGHAFRLMASGGMIANWDHIRKADGLYREGSSHALTEASEEDQLAIFRQVGFADVRTDYRDGGQRGLFVGRKP